MGVKGYKGFGPGMVSRDRRYAMVFEEQETKICESGMLFCVPPLGVLRDYPPVDYDGRSSEYAEVEAEADSSTDDEIKYTTTKLRVGAKISLAKLAEAHVDWVKKQITCVPATKTGDWSAATKIVDRSAAINSGYRSAATNTGDCSVATNTGNWSAATNTGYYSAAEVSGSESVAIVTGHNSKVRGALGCWIVAAECDDIGHILCVKAACVDGKKIKADTWYKLDNGEFEEA